MQVSLDLSIKVILDIKCYALTLNNCCLPKVTRTIKIEHGMKCSKIIGRATKHSSLLIVGDYISRPHVISVHSQDLDQGNL